MNKKTYIQPLTERFFIEASERLLGDASPGPRPAPPSPGSAPAVRSNAPVTF